MKTATFIGKLRTDHLKALTAARGIILRPTSDGKSWRVETVPQYAMLWVSTDRATAHLVYNVVKNVFFLRDPS